MIDYRDLLKRYIQHVGEEEGVTFIFRIRPPDDPDWADPDMAELMKHKVRFTQEEIEELERLEDE